LINEKAGFKKIKDDDYTIKVYEQEEVEGFYILKYYDKMVEIVRLIVDWVFRGKGVGSALLTDIILNAKIRGVKRVEIVVHEQDDYSINWLLKRGFVGVGVEKNYFKERDGYLLRREL